MKMNSNYRSLEESYLFSDIAKRVTEYQRQNPEKKIIRLGIGDVTLPLCQAVTSALSEAVAEMGEKETFHGYGPEQGYDFLKEAIQRHYQEWNVSLEAKEIFVSDGAKSDLGNILDLFSASNTVLIPNPVYPVYVDTNKMDGRKILFSSANQQNDFLPLPMAGQKVDIIYLCSPNNPTGAAYNREQLKKWVDYALYHNSILLFDAAYEAFIQEDGIPHSVFEIEGAKRCAIEFCSFSKTAGFTGTRCGYTVVPQELEYQGANLNRYWLRRQTTKFNGVSYIIQKGAAAVFSDEGYPQVKEAIAYYQENARILSEALRKKGIWFTGGKNSPYIWMKCPDGISSWDYFDLLLNQANVVGTPGSGFGSNGEGFFRFSSFGDREDTKEAVQRICSL